MADSLFVGEVLKGQSTEKLEKGGTATRLKKHLDRTNNIHTCTYVRTHTHTYVHAYTHIISHAVAT